MLTGLGWLATTVVFLNFNGARVSAGTEDAPRGQTMVLQTDATARTIPAFDGTPFAGTHTRLHAIETVVARARQLFAGYDLELTTQRPVQGEYSMVVIGGSSDDLHAERRAEDGIAVVDCGNAWRSNLAFVWSDELRPGPERSNEDALDEIAVVIAHELGHGFGLEHVTRADDVMHAGRVVRRTGFYGISALADGASACERSTAQDTAGRLAAALGTTAAGQSGASDVGEACQRRDQCKEGVCVQMSGWGFCSRSCELAKADSCPSDATCEVLSGAAYCVPTTVASGCSVARPGAVVAGSEAMGPLLLLLLLGVGLSRRPVAVARARILPRR